MEISKVKIGLAFTAVALGCAGATYYLFLKYKFATQDAANAFKYLQIQTVSTVDDCDRVAREIKSKSKQHTAIGFDCEWVTEKGSRHPVTLVQLSTLDGYCGLFRLSHLKTVPNSLKELLEDETIYKVGVAPLDDAKYLFQDYDVRLKSTLDLRHIALATGHHPGGLASLARDLLRVALDKSWRVRCSDWEQEELTERQTNYAAADAHVAIKIFVTLVNEFIGQKFKGHADAVWGNLECLLDSYADVHFKVKPQEPNNRKNKTGKLQRSDKADKESRRYPHSTRSKPLYHNCFMQAPDGELLCTCDTKKAQWYVDRGLADLVTSDPFTVRLRFEPAGRSLGEVGRYYQLLKENRCVVCGRGDSYIRKNVVPREYRKNFPEIMKDHSSHDVVLLCVECHKRSNMLDRRLRTELAEMCDAPLTLGANSKYVDNVDVKKVKSAARALLHQTKRHVLPAARRRELEATVLQHYPGAREITDHLLTEAASLKDFIENAQFEAHGDKVVQHFAARDGAMRLEEIWRGHFLRSMAPRHMPPLWSVTHNEERMRVRYETGRLSEEDLKMLGLTKWIS